MNTKPVNPADKPSTACSVPGPTTPLHWVAARDAAIADFLDRFASDCPDRDVLADLMVAITRLPRDGAGRGDLKLLTNSFKELRYAFKVFAPYKDIRKVSIFGSSRTRPDNPDYLQAVAFARRIRERQWMVLTGAGDGIMGAGQHGAGRSGRVRLQQPGPLGRGHLVRVQLRRCGLPGRLASEYRHGCR